MKMDWKQIQEKVEMVINAKAMPEPCEMIITGRDKRGEPDELFRLSVRRAKANAQGQAPSNQSQSKKYITFDISD